LEGAFFRAPQGVRRRDADSRYLLSVLVGPKKFIGTSRVVSVPRPSTHGLFACAEKCKWFRKCFGGGIRQCGGLATAANYALDHHLPLLPGTHVLAKRLAAPLAELGVQLMLPVETSTVFSRLPLSVRPFTNVVVLAVDMLWLQPSSIGFSIADLAARAKTRGITLGSNRVVVHHQITQEAIDDLVEVVREMKEEHKDKPRTEMDEAQNQRFAQGTWQGVIQPPIARLGVSYGKNQ
jgi:threonine aldolase